MSESNHHTPGPWRHDGDPFTPTVFSDKPRANGVRGVCEVDPGDDAVANARLIAAAPDLLAACEALLHLAGCDPREIGGVEKLVRDRARAAIARAKGEPDGTR